MACDFTALSADACTNRFACLTPEIELAIRLQILKEWSGSTESVSELLASACANGFACKEPADYEALKLQLLCDIRAAL